MKLALPLILCGLLFVAAVGPNVLYDYRQASAEESYLQMGMRAAGGDITAFDKLAGKSPLEIALMPRSITARAFVYMLQVYWKEASAVLLLACVLFWRLLKRRRMEAKCGN